MSFVKKNIRNKSAELEVHRKVGRNEHTEDLVGMCEIIAPSTSGFERRICGYQIYKRKL